jgi:hypothetical protein
MGEQVATGIFYYDGEVPRPISVHRKEARFASSRWNHDTDGEPELDETRPIPETREAICISVFLPSLPEKCFPSMT